MLYILCSIAIGFVILALIFALAAAILEILFPFIMVAVIIIFACWAVGLLSRSRHSRFGRY